MCDRIFKRTVSLNRHAETCCTAKQEIYPGGKYRKDRTLFGCKGIVVRRAGTMNTLLALALKLFKYQDMKS